MKERLGQYINKLMVREHYNQSALARELGISRQMLSNIVLDQKEVSLPLSLKIESLFSLPEGTILKIQNDCKIRQYKEELRKGLFEKLIQARAFLPAPRGAQQGARLECGGNGLDQIQGVDNGSQA